jgi:CHASE3 domain sensor protein
MRRLKEALHKEEKAIKWLTIVLVALTLIIYIHPPAGD